MDNDNTNQPPANDPYGTQNQPQQSVPGSAMPSPQQPVAPQQNPAAAQPQQSQRPPLRIDHNLLADLGLAALPDEEKKALEKHIYETLEMRVGMRLADQMTNEQLDEFETYFNARDDAGAFHWLETNFPNYKDIVADEFDKLKSEVAVQAPAILAASQQQANQEMPQTQQAPEPQMQMQPEMQQQPQQPHQPGFPPQSPQQPQMPVPPQPEQQSWQSSAPPQQQYPQDETQQPPQPSAP